jgi:hypothetical protein
MQRLDERLPAVLAGTEKATPADLLAMAAMCYEYKKHHNTAVQLYQRGFETQPKLLPTEKKRHEENRIRAAVLAAVGQGADADKLQEPEKAKLRHQARLWLKAELEAQTKNLKSDRALAILEIEALSRWQADPNLEIFRASKEPNRLPDAEVMAWKKFWTDLADVVQKARERFAEKRENGTLTKDGTSKNYDCKFVAGRTYVLDLESPDFDTLIKLQDSQGNLLAENDDISPDNQNSRLVYTAAADGNFRIVVTSYAKAGEGAYTLRIRELLDVK